MSLSNDQVRRLARLARLVIPADESGAVIDRLNRVLGLIDQMRAVDTAGIEPMAHPLDAQLPQGQRLRADEVTEEGRRDAYQAAAAAGPDGNLRVQDGFYLVPKVIE